MSDNNVIIRPINENDTNNIVRWRNNPNVQRNFIYQNTFTIESHMKWYKEKVITKKVYQFIIEYEGRPVGSIYLRDVDYDNRKAEYGIFIGEDDMRGKGIGGAASRQIIDFAFNTLKLHKVFLRVLGENQAAIRSYEKVGFCKEGVAVDDVCINGAYKDIIFMSIINER